MASERTTITLPKDLNERLKAVKSHINVSGICQKAIESAVIAEEAKINGEQAIAPDKPKWLEDLNKQVKSQNSETSKHVMIIEMMWSTLRGLA
jgi:PHP family Zn ribbon phosphoesterase